ncbi:MAG: hypothetical protein HRU09_12750 [Oligoflexales bacterium]|nr:hypothetical protein [Oligoflexales bacterium]
MRTLRIILILIICSACSEANWLGAKKHDQEDTDSVEDQANETDLPEEAEDQPSDTSLDHEIPPEQDTEESSQTLSPEANYLEEKDVEALEEEDSVFLTPDYSNPEFKASSEYPFELILETVLANQDKGEAYAEFLAANGAISTDEGTITLTQISANECPGYLESCLDIDHEKLGIPNKAVLSGFVSGTNIKNQGERGTCVAFALNAAVELLIKQSEGETDLSEQNTYLQAKQLTDSWTYAGLAPEFTIEQFVNERRPFVLESAWPYNPKGMDCSAYQQDHPEATCSQTEAQGGGESQQEADPQVSESQGFIIKEAHQLFASVGRVKQAIAQDYPVVLGVNANHDFNLVFYNQARKHSIKNGVVSWVFKDDACGKSVCGHALLAVGYHDDPEVEGGGYLIVQNSWGTSWGEQGIAYLTYEWLKYNLLDAQAIVKVEKQIN